jgi:uroporphyrinogen decarboxylase
MSAFLAAVAPESGAKRESPRRGARAIPLTARERFLRACRVLPVDRPPFWIMRQAGRALPEYRKLKEKYSFLQLAQTPELAAEVTLQPVRRFGFDAAIIFSDILVVPEAMGIGYSFRESGGVRMDFTIRSDADVRKLSTESIAERLQYVARAISLAKHDLQERTALLGFAGSPWTLANYMLEGGGVGEHTRALALFHTDRALFDKLSEKLMTAVSAFLQMQIHAGVDAVQIFDSLGGLLPRELFHDASGKWLARIVREIRGNVPVIVFSKGTRNWSELADLGANVIGIDHGVSLSEAAACLPNSLAVQGNLDPDLLLGSPTRAAEETQALMSEMNGRQGWIFNLGHGLPPKANLECISAIAGVLRS